MGTRQVRVDELILQSTHSHHSFDRIAEVMTVIRGRGRYVVKKPVEAQE